uniref:ATP-binding protein n=1 Tax=Strongyloides papillosus TaxID=174720 RepID=A0A0N5BUN7_STREA
MRKLFKRNTPKRYEATQHQLFAAAYAVLQKKWLREQADSRHLSSEEQNKISLNQNKELIALIESHGFDKSRYLSEFPIPLTTDNTFQLDLLPHEKELDATLRKEIGKIIPFLTTSSIVGVERYITKKDILNRLAVFYLPALLVKDKGPINSYYNQHLVSMDPNVEYTLTSTLENIVALMDNDSHRARLGMAITPPRQNNSAIGNYITRFENFVLQIDGIRMDSVEIIDNTPLNNERRRQFINDLDNNIRVIVTQPENFSQWHAFTQPYAEGYIRLYPNRPLYDKPSALHKIKLFKKYKKIYKIHKQ